MLGAIIGDIVGSTYEVHEVKSLKNKQIDYLNRIKILDKSVPLFNKNSSYTDDTVLTCAIAKALLTDKNYYNKLKEFGNREINLGLDKYGRSRFSRNFCDWLKGSYIGESYGNGCAMRISPIASYYNNIIDIIDNVYLATNPTHNNYDSYIYTEIVALCIHFAKEKKSKEFIKKYIEKEYKCSLDFNLEYLQKNYKFTSKVCDSVPQAIFCFLESIDFEDAIRKAISIGGDSDTIAAITGSIAEVYYGIDKKLIKRVEKYLPEYIINIVNDFYKAIGKEEPFKNEVKDFFKLEGVYSEEFFDYIKDKVKTVPSLYNFNGYGCFPLLEDEILKDIAVLVPEIVDERTLLINIHEYAHALDLFNGLNTVYEDKKEDRENYASSMEKKYIKRKNI